MRETIRCCISCILPCGALDVIRIVHVNGRVEEISHAVRAGEVMQAYPKHVLRKPPSSSSSELDGDAPKGPVILPPNAQLQKGKIYFLMPVSSPPEKARPAAPSAAPAAAAAKRKKKKRETSQGHGNSGATNDTATLLMSDQYLSEILSEKVSTQRDRRRGRVGVWRPHLESISEISNDF